MKRVAIIGGGISGLSAAFYLEQLRRNGAPLEYQLFEASSRLGGVIRTDSVDGCLVEAGPDSFLSAKPWAADLARAAGIADELLPSSDHRRRTYILHRNALLPMPDGMQMMVPTRAWPILTTPLLSFSTKCRMLGEFLAPPPPHVADDESVAAFIGRHFGSEVVTTLAGPLLAGIYGGDASTLSARAALPSLVALESKHRSLVRGTLRAIAERDNSSVPVSLFTSFRLGMQQLVDSVAAGIPPASLRLNTEVTALAKVDSGWQLTAGGAPPQAFSHVILAVPSYAAAALLSFDLELSARLAGIRYTDSITVALGFSCDHIRRSALPAGFGFLVPRSEGRRIIACTFVHSKFDFRAPGDRLLLRAFLTGGLELSDELIVAAVQRELAEILRIDCPMQFARVYRWPRAMPQYEVGHLQKMDGITQSLASLPGLQLIGNAYRGLGIPDCIREGKLAAEQTLCG